jgi:hypothetical protein
LAAGAAAPVSEGDAAAAGRQSGGRIVLEPSPGALAVEPLLARLWDSRFFRRNEAVWAEILDNRYVLFEEGAPGFFRGKTACFSRRQGGQDVIFLRKDLLSHFELGMEGITEHINVIKKVLPILVHEICHDLWANTLDDRERAAFSRECYGLMGEYRLAVTAEEQRLFLFHTGDDPAGPLSLRSYSGIDSFLATDPPRGLFGQELFAWFAERLFMTKAAIPKPLGKYYSCIIEGLPPDAARPRR